MISKSQINQTLATTIATIGVFGLGVVLGWSSPALPNMLQEHQGHFRNISTEEQSWIGSVATLGALAACPVAGISVDSFGRKKTMQVFAIPFALGWIFIGFSTKVIMLCIGRFVTGFCGGVFSLSVPVYVGETVESNIRGTLMNLFQLMLVSGILFSYILGTLVSWKALALISSLISILGLILLSLLPESPRYLISQNRLIEAQRSICWLRGTDNTSLITEELSIVQDSVEESAASKLSYKDFLTPSILHPLCISLLLMVLEQASAFNVVIFYCVEIFQSAGTALDANASSIIVGSIQVVATIGSTFLVDRFGRRILLILSELFMALSFVALGLFFYIQSSQPGNVAPSGLTWLPLVSVAVFIIAFAVGIGPLSWTIMGEILHPNVKGKCSAIATSFVWFSAFIVTKIYASLVAAVGVAWAFWIFSGVSFLGTALVFICVPETKGKTLDDIQAIFSNKGQKRKQPIPPNTITP